MASPLLAALRSPLRRAAPARPAPTRTRRVPADPVWARWCVLALLPGTAVRYLWDLGASGWANAFSSAARVAAHHHATTVGGTTVDDPTAPAV